jgi:lysophospholipase L1-like esterase
LRDYPLKVRALFALALTTMIGVGVALSAEAACQVAYRFTQGSWLFLSEPEKPALAFDRHPYLVGVPRPHFEAGIIKHNSLGYRGPEPATPKMPGSKRIVALGGSSTYCTGVPEDATWPAMLQRDLGDGVEVFNLGVPGYSSVENLIQTALVISDLRPDIAIYYEGWNDLRSAHIKDLKPDYSNYHPRALFFSLYLNPVPPRDKSAVMFFLRNRVFSSSWQDPVSHFSYEPGPGALTDEVDPRALSLYERNLRSIAALDRSMGVAPVFVPQVLNYAKFTSNQPYGWMPLIKDKDVRKLLAAYNATMQRVAAELNVAFVGEVLSEDFPPSAFIDNGHFNQAGSARFAAILAKYFEQHPDLR